MEQLFPELIQAIATALGAVITATAASARPIIREHS
jgi:hypothetical protein